MISCIALRQFKLKLLRVRWFFTFLMCLVESCVFVACFFDRLASSNDVVCQIDGHEIHRCSTAPCRDLTPGPFNHHTPIVLGQLGIHLDRYLVIDELLQEVSVM